MELKGCENRDALMLLFASSYKNLISCLRYAIHVCWFHNYREGAVGLSEKWE